MIKRLINILIIGVSIVMFLAIGNVCLGNSDQTITIDWSIAGRFRLVNDSAIGDALGRLAMHADNIRGGMLMSNPGDKSIIDLFDSTVNNEKIFDKVGGYLGFYYMPTTEYNDITGSYTNDYAPYPKSWRIVLNAKGTASSDICTWYDEKGEELRGNGKKGNCEIYLPERKFGREKSKVQLKVVRNNASAIEVTSMIEPKDILVVGLGDSYASGEGNPDVQATWTKDAIWLDKKCHRSLFSWQSLIAARLASENPHRSVTFISFACSGAETRHLFRNSYEGIKRSIKTNGKMMLDPQLTSLKRVLCLSKWDEKKKCQDNLFRTPDLVLLSTGGNDVGFGPLIVDSIERNVADNKDAQGESTDLKWKYKDRIDRDLVLVSSDLKQLAQELKMTFKVDTGKSYIKVVHANYPNPLMRNGAAGEYCGSGKDYAGNDVVHLMDDFLAISWFTSVLKMTEWQNELIAIHDDFIIPLTGTTANDAENEYLCQGLRQLGIALQCINDHPNNADLSYGELSTVARHPVCKKYWEPGLGFTKFLKEKPWTPVMLRNEECSKTGCKQVSGFVANGYCVNKEGMDGRWFNIAVDSFARQGSKHGVFHPNFYGHLYYVNRVFPAVKAALNEN